MTTRFVGCVLVAAVSLAVIVAPGAARPAAANPTSVENLVREQMRAHDIPGAAVVVVSGGRQTLAEGYGTADIATGQPIRADQTLFPIDSIAKVLTSTAVMQLVDDGRLELDRDVNTYLDGFAIADTYPGEPVTLRHLLTHTAGFEEQVRGMMPASFDDIRPLAEFLAAKQPKRVRPPGQLVAYSSEVISPSGDGRIGRHG
jgi:CubicO group peptidase (beta-lactamase class C family)